MNRKKLIIAASAILIILIGLIVWGLVAREKVPSEDQLLVELPGLPKDQWSRVIKSEEDKTGYKKLTNQFDGYEITIPSDWITAEIATSGGYGAAYNNLSLNIFVVGAIEDAKFIFPESARFVEVETPIGKAYKTANKILGEDAFQDGEIVNLPIEDSLSTGYIFPTEKRVYIVLCSALGDNFEAMVNLCEKQIATFKILK